MERFDPIYPFTTENIAGYMQDLSLENKKIITVTGSTDHILNAITQGATDITTFDINKKAKFYLDLKIAAITNFSYNEFCKTFLYDTKESFQQTVIKELSMPLNSKEFWLEELKKNQDNGLALKKSSLFYRKYFNPKNIKIHNIYLEEKNYETIQKNISSVKITFLNKNLKELTLNSQYDYLFLSNIADYLSYMYKSNELASFKQLLLELNNKVSNIYFAYLYDIGNKKPRSIIDSLNSVQKALPQMEIKTFKSALESQPSNKKDGVLILKKEVKKYV